MFVLFSLATLASLPFAAPLRVAIIGAGISGGSTSYYLQELILHMNESAPRASITAFDSSGYIGGRLKHTTFTTSSGERVGVELGGAAWTNGNQWVRSLAAKLGINTTQTTDALRLLRGSGVNDPGLPSGDGGWGSGDNLLGALGIWQGSSFVDIPLVALRNAGGLVRVAAAEAAFLAAIKTSYDRQRTAPPFTSLAEFVTWGNLSRYTSNSIRGFFGALGVKEELIAAGLGPLTRAIYNRDCDANAFALLASLTASLSHHSVVGGKYVYRTYSIF